MIKYINEAINRKLNSMSFTTIVKGTVESTEPLKIRLNDRIVIGQSFIEPMSLGIDGNSPGSALPLIVGEVVNMVRYNNGQRFYILRKENPYKVGDMFLTTNEEDVNERLGGTWELKGEQEICGINTKVWVRIS